MTISRAAWPLAVLTADGHEGERMQSTPRGARLREISVTRYPDMSSRVAVLGAEQLDGHSRGLESHGFRKGKPARARNAIAAHLRRLSTRQLTALAAVVTAEAERRAVAS
jgi:hypothetical protein